MKWNETHSHRCDQHLDDTHKYSHLEDPYSRSVLHSIVEFIVAFSDVDVAVASAAAAALLSGINLAKVIAFNCHLTNDKWCWFTHWRAGRARRRTDNWAGPGPKIIYFGHMYFEDFQPKLRLPRRLKSYWPWPGQLFNCHELWPALPKSAFKEDQGPGRA